MSIEITRIHNGIFSVFMNAEDTSYQIINSSMGMSGCGANHYSIKKPDGKYVMVGSLQKAKKTMIKWLES